MASSYENYQTGLSAAFSEPRLADIDVVLAIADGLKADDGRSRGEQPLLFRSVIRSFRDGIGGWYLAVATGHEDDVARFNRRVAAAVAAKAGVVGAGVSTADETYASILGASRLLSETTHILGLELGLVRRSGDTLNRLREVAAELRVVLPGLAAPDEGLVAALHEGLDDIKRFIDLAASVFPGQLLIEKRAFAGDVSVGFQTCIDVRLELAIQIRGSIEGRVGRIDVDAAEARVAAVCSDDELRDLDIPQVLSLARETNAGARERRTNRLVQRLLVAAKQDNPDVSDIDAAWAIITGQGQALKAVAQVPAFHCIEWSRALQAAKAQADTARIECTVLLRRIDRISVPQASASELLAVLAVPAPLCGEEALRLAQAGLGSALHDQECTRINAALVEAVKAQIDLALKTRDETLLTVARLQELVREEWCPPRRRNITALLERAAQDISRARVILGDAIVKLVQEEAPDADALEQGVVDAVQQILTPTRNALADQLDAIREIERLCPGLVAPTEAAILAVDRAISEGPNDFRAYRTDRLHFDQFAKWIALLENRAAEFLKSSLTRINSLIAAQDAPSLDERAFLSGVPPKPVLLKLNTDFDKRLRALQDREDAALEGVRRVLLSLQRIQNWKPAVNGGVISYQSFVEQLQAALERARTTLQQDLDALAKFKDALVKQYPIVAQPATPTLNVEVKLAPEIESFIQARPQLDWFGGAADAAIRRLRDHVAEATRVKDATLAARTEFIALIPFWDTSRRYATFLALWTQDCLTVFQDIAAEVERQVRADPGRKDQCVQAVRAAVSGIRATWNGLHTAYTELEQRLSTTLVQTRQVARRFDWAQRTSVILSDWDALPGDLNVKIEAARALLSEIRGLPSSDQLAHDPSIQDIAQLPSVLKRLNATLDTFPVSLGAPQSTEMQPLYSSLDRDLNSLRSDLQRSVGVLGAIEWVQLERERLRQAVASVRPFNDNVWSLEILLDSEEGEIQNAMRDGDERAALKSLGRLETLIAENSQRTEWSEALAELGAITSLDLRLQASIVQPAMTTVQQFGRSLHAMVTRANGLAADARAVAWLARNRWAIDRALQSDDPGAIGVLRDRPGAAGAGVMSELSRLGKHVASVDARAASDTKLAQQRWARAITDASGLGEQPAVTRLLDLERVCLLCSQRFTFRGSLGRWQCGAHPLAYSGTGDSIVNPENKRYTHACCGRGYGGVGPVLAPDPLSNGVWEGTYGGAIHGCVPCDHRDDIPELQTSADDLVMPIQDAAYLGVPLGCLVFEPIDEPPVNNRTAVNQGGEPELVVTEREQPGFPLKLLVRVRQFDWHEDRMRRRSGRPRDKTVPVLPPPIFRIDRS